MMSNNNFIAIIDTNAVSALSLYVVCCNAIGKDLEAIYIRSGSTAEIKQIIESEFKVQTGIGRDFLNIDAVVNGWKTYSYIRARLASYEKLSVMFPHLCEIELLHMFLERVFDKELTRKGIPYRIRKNRPFRVQVGFSYDTEVFGYWENIRNALGKYGIEFGRPEDDYDIKDIASISHIISRYIALDPVDLYLYAIGILERADEIYTYDSEFRKIIHSVKSDGGESWGNIRNSICRDLKYIPSFREQSSIDLPDGVNK